MKDKFKMGYQSIKVMIVFFFLYNSYFGWNKTAESDVETICDNIFDFGILIAFGIYLIPVIRYVENKINKEDNL